jgi:hypothetical protein
MARAAHRHAASDHCRRGRQRQMTFGIDGAMRFNIREPPPIPAIPTIQIGFVPDREWRPAIFASE